MGGGFAGGMGGCGLDAVGAYSIFGLVRRSASDFCFSFKNGTRTTVPRDDKNPGSLGQTWDQVKSLNFILIDSNFLTVPCPQSSCHAMCFPSLFEEFFNETEKSFWKNTLQGFPGVREMGDARESLLPAPNYNRPVKGLVYKDLLASPSP
jgi:hypothetical protein